VDTEGNSRKLQRKRMRNAPPNMKAMLKELKGFNGMVVSLSLFTLKKRGRRIAASDFGAWRGTEASFVYQVVHLKHDTQLSIHKATHQQVKSLPYV
jgi:hypothetical protein